MSRLAVSLLYFLSHQLTTSSSVDCVSITGKISESTQGSLSTAKCDDPYTLISCGFKTSDINQWFIQGSYINNDQCYAENPKDSPGVYAIARCCNLTPYNLTCNTYQSNPTQPRLDGTTDDCVKNVSCASSNEVLMGCTANTGNNGSIDGAYPGSYEPWNFNQNPNVPLQTSNTCNGMAAWFADATYAHGTCCQPPKNENEMKIRCMMVAGERSGNVFGSNSGQFSSVKCPGNSFMASCSGHSYWRSTNAWYIGEDDICYARVSDPWIDNYNTTATAICCDIDTSSPTNAPTLNPTLNPSSNPSSGPTLEPTSDPTGNPTFFPTIRPTYYPTLEPTIVTSTIVTSEPTLDPTINPSTENPTQRPSDAPTVNSTLNEKNGVVPVLTTLTTNEPSGTNETKLVANNVKSAFLSYLLIALIIILCIMCICVLYFLNKQRKLSKQKKKALYPEKALSIESITKVYSNSTHSRKDTIESFDGTVTAQNRDRLETMNTNPIHKESASKHSDEPLEVKINMKSNKMLNLTNDYSINNHNYNQVQHQQPQHQQPQQQQPRAIGNGMMRPQFQHNNSNPYYANRNGYATQNSVLPQQIQMGVIVNNHIHQYGHMNAPIRNHRRILTTELAKDVDLPEDTPMDDDPEGTMATFKARKKQLNNQQRMRAVQTMGVIVENNDDMREEYDEMTDSDATSDDGRQTDVMYNPNDTFSSNLGIKNVYDDNMKEEGSGTDTVDDLYEIDDNINNVNDNDYGFGQTRR